jgi:predicted NAD/FAD-binding protein
MFRIKWIERGKEDEPVEVENSILTDLERVVTFCREALYGMKLRHIRRPPDGFVVVDADGREVRRWFDSTGPDPA